MKGDEVRKSGAVQTQKVAQILREALCDREPCFVPVCLFGVCKPGDIIVIFVQRKLGLEWGCK